MINPFEIQRQMLVEFEKSMGEAMTKTMREPGFMQLVAQNMGSTLDFRALLKTQVESTLKSLDLLTPKDAEVLYQTVHALETKVLDLEEQLQEATAELQVLRAAAAPKKAARKAKP